MSKELKDYLHLYGIGVEVIFDNKIWKVQQLRPKTVRLTRISEGGYHKWNECNYSEMFILLRPLQSMTKDELQECGNLVYDFSDDPELNNHRPEDFEITTPEQMHWLLKRHFDIFGLIESGIAIDASKINKP